MSKGLPQLYFDKVKAAFYGDTDRTWMWFKTPNSNLGGVSPLDMIRVGRMNKLVSYINEAQQGKKAWK